MTVVGLIYSLPATLPLILLIYNLIPFNSFEPNYVSFIITAIGHRDLYSIWFFINSLYFLILFPISLIAVVNMAKNDGKLSYAFKFKEIFDKIKNIGWIKFYSWYLLTNVFSYLIFLIGFLILVIYILTHIFPYVRLIDLLILTPYTYIFFS